MSHVFISYVRENSALVDRLVSELRAAGVDVWLDRENIKPGARWRDAIRDAIRHGAFFIACFSEEDHARDISYGNEELTIAIDQLRQMPTDRAWFIPVMLNHTQLPSRRISAVEDLSDIQVVRLYNNWDDGIRHILSVIKAFKKQ